MRQLTTLLHRKFAHVRSQTVRIVFGGALLTWLLISGASYRATMQLKADAQWVAHTHEVIARLDQLKGTIGTAEIEQHGFTLTGNTEELDAFNKTSRQAPQQLGNLRTLIEDNAAQLDQLVALETKIQDLFALYQINITWRQQQGTDLTAPITLINQTRQPLSEIDGMIRVMVDEENRLLTEREARWNTSDQSVFIVLIGGPIIIGLLLVTIFYFLDREISSRKHTEEALRKSDKLYRTFVHNFPNGSVLLFDLDLRFLVADGAGLPQVGFSREMMEGKTIWEVFSPDFAKETMEPLFRTALSGETKPFEIAYAGRIRAGFVLPVRDESDRIFAGMIMTQDVTERKQTDNALQQYMRRTETLAEISHLSAEIISDYSSLIDIIARRTAELVGDGCVLTLLSDDAEWLAPVSLYHVNPEAERFFKEITVPSRVGAGLVGHVYSTGQPLMMPVIDQAQIRASLNPIYWPYLEQFGIHSLLIVPLRVQGKVIGTLGLTRDKPGQPYTSEDQTFLQNLANRSALAISNAKLLMVQQEELTARKRIEEILLKHDAQLAKAQEIAHMGSWDHDLLTGVMIWSDQLFRIYGFKPQTFDPNPTVFYQHMHPGDVSRVKNIIAGIFKDPKPFSFEYRIIQPDSSVHTLLVTSETSVDQSGQLLRIVGIVQDITEQKAADEALAMAVEDLKRSNEELEQFAYVASHDLQEPLRMVASYVELLRRRYQGQLDDKADKYITYAVDGAVRMQQLINDLLTYSRLGKQDWVFTSVDGEKLLKHTLTNLDTTIKEQKANITHDPLPTVLANESQFGQLLQNLIGNAIKFHGNEAPCIHVSAQRVDDVWQFSIRDNGIGIAPEYAERIFVIFKRLHTHSEYPGTGIGLAVCKKIVEQHGGQIWLDSKPDKGTTFFFTIPVREAELNVR
jgi:PAS domain S-box-containing protein